MRSRIVLLAILMAASALGHAEDAGECGYEMYQVTSPGTLDVYEFPVVPGTPEWGAMEEQEKRESYQIPGEILDRISTKGLAWTCLKSPRRHFWLYDGMARPLTGVRSVIRRSNGFRELLRRPDVGAALFKMYAEMDPDALQRDYELTRRRQERFYKVFREQGPEAAKEAKRAARDEWLPDMEFDHFQWDFALLEMLLGLEEVLSTMTPETKVDLLAICLERYATRVRRDQGSLTIHLLMARILRDLGFRAFEQRFAESADLRAFVAGPSMLGLTEQGTLDSIRDLARECLAERRKGESR